MKHFTSIHALFAALLLAAPVTGLSSPESPGGFHGRRLTSGFHGRFFHRGPRFFYGGAPFFWGPAIGFSFYGSPGYYYYDDGPDRPVYRGIPQTGGDSKDIKDARDAGDNLNMEVQNALADQGFYHGPIDGEIGAGSRAAIRAYQSAHGLQANGRIDNALLRSLHID
jgi:hypothetical protein